MPLRSGLKTNILPICYYLAAIELSLVTNIRTEHLNTNQYRPVFRKTQICKTYIKHHTEILIFHLKKKLESD